MGTSEDHNKLENLGMNQTAVGLFEGGSSFLEKRQRMKTLQCPKTPNPTKQRTATIFHGFQLEGLYLLQAVLGKKGLPPLRR